MEPSQFKVRPVGRGELACEWEKIVPSNKVNHYEIQLYDYTLKEYVKYKNISSTDNAASFTGLPSHRDYAISLRACFNSGNLSGIICGDHITKHATTIPGGQPLNI